MTLKYGVIATPKLTLDTRILIRIILGIFDAFLIM